jgi:hypothetical protein
MLKKQHFSLLWLLPAFLYVIWYLAFTVAKTGALKSLTFIENMGSFVAMALGVLGLGLILMAASGADPTPQPSTHQARNWFIPFLTLLLSLAALVIFVNPHGRYPWAYYPFTTTSARYQKLKLLSKLDYSPEVIILGSSHAFAIPSSYLEQTLGAKAFNMAVEAGGPMEQLMLTQYMLDHGADAPKLIVAEMVAPSLLTKSWQYSTPLNLLSYVPIDKKWSVLKTIFFDTLSMRSLADSFFLMARFNSKEYMTFQPDGTGIRGQRTAEAYATEVEKQMKNVYQRYLCKSIDAEGKKSIENLVALGEKYKFSLVFYNSPLNIEFFEQSNTDNPLYKKCLGLLESYMKKLAAAHPNVQYVNLTYYEPVTLLREDGFVDVQHPNAQASMLIMDALLPQLQKGLAWANQNRP